MRSFITARMPAVNDQWSPFLTPAARGKGAGPHAGTKTVPSVVAS